MKSKPLLHERHLHRWTDDVAVDADADFYADADSDAGAGAGAADESEADNDAGEGLSSFELGGGFGHEIVRNYN